MEKGLRVKVYDGDFIGFTTAVLQEQYQVIEANVLEKWIVETEDGTTLLRYIKNHSKAMKDGCGYQLESLVEVDLDVDSINELYMGKEFRYISNTGVIESFIFENIAVDNAQVNGVYNPANCYCMEV